MLPRSSGEHTRLACCVRRPAEKLFCSGGCDSTIHSLALPRRFLCFPNSTFQLVAVCTRRVQRGGYSRSLSHHGRGWGVGRGLGAGVDLGVAIGVGQGVTVDVAVGLGVGVGLGKHALTTSTKRATTCWLPWSVVCTPVTRKPPSLLLETTDPRAGDWIVPTKTSTASPSKSPSEDKSCTQ